MTDRIRAALLMDPALTGFVLDGTAREALREVCDIDLEDPARAIADLRDPATIEVLITGWGAPPLGPAALDTLPSLRAVAHWGGGLAHLDALDARGIAVSTAKAANAVPVAEFTIAMITLAAKDVFWAARRYAAEQRFIDREAEYGRTGLGDAAVGVIGASAIGVLVIAELRRRGITTLLHDPTIPADRADELGVELVDDLVDLARRSRILTVHAPDIPATRGMVSAEVLAALPDDATLVNTARGILVDQDALVAELTAGRLRAVLDVTEPDVLPIGHPLYTLANVFLTPHLAGSMGTELRALGAHAVDEVMRFVRTGAFADPVPSRSDPARPAIGARA